VLSDRFCIASDGEVDVILSPEDMLECDTKDKGCNGGMLNRAWKFLTNVGITSDDCIPYISGSGTVPQCKTQCANPSEDFKLYKC